MQCSETGCMHLATHAPKICIPATGWPQDEKRALTMILGVKLCLGHVATFTPGQVMDVPNEKGSTLRDILPILTRLNGSTVPPDPDRAWIVPLALTSAEFKSFEQVADKSS
jgi:hypothetical protein